MSEEQSPVASYYDRAAGDWDAAHADRQNPIFARQIRSCLSRLFEPARGSNLAVELGAGTGPYIGIVAPMVDRLICTDISTGMLEVLEQRRNRLGIKNVEILQQDAAKLDGIADATVDAVYSVGMFETVPEPEPVFRSARRVLKSGGLFAGITSNGQCPWYSIRKRIEGGERAGHIVRYMTPGEVHELAGRTGFSVSAVECWGLVPPGISNPVIARALDIAGTVLRATPLKQYLGVLSFGLIAR